VLLLALGSLAACAGSGQSVQTPVVSPAQPQPNDAVNATLWTLSSAEYDAVTLGIYSAAGSAIDAGLKDSTWTALPDQRVQEGYASLPAAVILDVDETVLDNGEYQADLILEDREYATDSWLEWVLEENAPPIPGALHFCRTAAAKGVTVIYLTNRRGHMEDATRANLYDLGFPIDTTFDVVLTRGEREEWSRGEKTSRRNFVAEHFRVLALLGDNLGDFVDVDGLGLVTRDYAVEQNRQMWGKYWFMIPNAMYGSWESTLFNGQFRLPAAERRQMKIDVLRRRYGN